MTVFRTFPFCFGLLAFALCGGILTRIVHMGGIGVWGIAVASGVVSWVLCQKSLRMLAAWLDRRESERWKWQSQNRTYLDLDSMKDYPSESNLFYECLVCGNAVPSRPRGNFCCKCRNVCINPNSGGIEIQNRAKAKVFTVPAL